MKAKAPILFFAYNRPEHTKRSLESLSNCEGAAESELFIFCDGPKKKKDEPLVKEVRALAKSRKWCGKVNVIERDENLGLADSIISGVTEIVNRYGRIIVLEDDLVLSPQFLNYMNDALEVYKDVPKVMHISGYFFPLKPKKLPETFFLRLVSSWGWATWRSSWEKFEPDMSVHMKRLQDCNFRSGLDAGGAVKAGIMLEAQNRGEIDSWAIRWYSSVYFHGGLSLYPQRSFVKNIGHDRSGRHCSKTLIYDTVLWNKRVMIKELIPKENEMALAEVMAFYRRNDQFLHKTYNKIKSLFG